MTATNRHWSFTLWTLFVGVTAIAALIGCFKAYPLSSIAFVVWVIGTSLLFGGFAAIAHVVKWLHGKELRPDSPIDDSDSPP